MKITTKWWRFYEISTDLLILLVFATAVSGFFVKPDDPSDEMRHIDKKLLELDDEFEEYKDAPMERKRQ